ncbi:MAG: leucine-rich repeat protein [Ruminococcus sp.]|nr:leucine-rich repeat protein [Ruminococcus sp.]
MFKKLLSCAAALLLIFGTMAVLPEDVISDNILSTAFAENETAVQEDNDGEDWDTVVSEPKMYEDFEFVLLKNGTAKITAYKGSYTQLGVPDMVDGHKVSLIAPHAIGYTYQNGNYSPIDGFIIKTTPGSAADIYSGTDGNDFYCWYYSGDFAYGFLDENNVAIYEWNGSNSDLVIPDTLDGHPVTWIKDWVFSGRSEIKTLVLGKNMEEICQGAFHDCPNLKSVTFNSSLKDIRENAFKFCTSLKTVNIPKSVDLVDSCAFWGCSSLESVTFNSSPSIEWACFFDCPKLNSVTIAGNSPIAENAFGYGFIDASFTDDWKSQRYEEDNIKKYTNFTISGQSGTNAEKYANENGFKFNYTGGSIAKATVTGISNKSYTGSAIKPAPVVKLGSTTLKSGTDYTVAYKNNTNAGTATVTITGKGSYTGTITKTFKITAASIAKATVSGLKNKYYTGKAITQTPTVKLGSKTLKKGTDYTVTFKNNKAIGTATVTIKGKGNYTGTVTKTFKIIPKKTTLKTAASPKKGQLKVTYTKQTNITGYQITYALDKNFTKSKASKSSAKLTKTISGLKSGKTYYVKVRTYKTVNGTKYYSGYSVVKKIKVK